MSKSNSTNSADTERVAFEAARESGVFNPADDHVPTWYANNLRLEGWMARASIPAAADVAADIPTWKERRDLSDGSCADPHYMKAEIADLRAALAASVSPKTVAYLVESRRPGKASTFATLPGYFLEPGETLVSETPLGMIGVPTKTLMACKACNGIGTWIGAGGGADDADCHACDGSGKSAPQIEATTAGAEMADCGDCEGTGRLSGVELCQRCNESGILPATAPDVAKDAARYRWLLENYAFGDGYRTIDAALNDGDADINLSPAIDAQIAAMGALPPAGGGGS